MPSSTLTSKGQATIPKAIRDRLGLSAGDRVDFAVDPDGRVVLRAALPIQALDGALDRSGQLPVSLDAMQAAIEAEAAKSGR
ncbi:MAG: AbrB/MazE/SpoVT family DNA-binding domain-containing protein [Bacteroidota bacterium]